MPRELKARDPNTGEIVSFRWLDDASDPTQDDLAQVFAEYRIQNPSPPPTVTEEGDAESSWIQHQLGAGKKADEIFSLLKSNPTARQELTEHGMDPDRVLTALQGPSFMQRAGENLRGLYEGAKSLTPLAMLEGKMPGQAMAEGIVSNIGEQARKIPQSKSATEAVMRSAALPFEAVAPVTELGEALSEGNYGKLGADAATMLALGGAGRRLVKPRFVKSKPPIPDAGPSARMIDVAGPPKYSGFESEMRSGTPFERLEMPPSAPPAPDLSAMIRQVAEGRELAARPKPLQLPDRRTGISEYSGPDLSGPITPTLPQHYADLMTSRSAPPPVRGLLSEAAGEPWVFGPPEGVTGPMQLGPGSQTLMTRPRFRDATTRTNMQRQLELLQRALMGRD